MDLPSKISSGPERIGRHIVIETQERSCERHGPYTAKKWAMDPPPKAQPNKPLPAFLKPFWGQCPTCDKEMQAEADQRDELIRSGKSVRERAMHSRLEMAGIPARYRDCSIWNWEHGQDKRRSVWGTVRDYAGQFELALETGRSLVFTGPPGTGKTHLAVGLLRHVIEKGGTGLYVTVAGAIMRLKSTFKDRGHGVETEKQVFEHLCSVDLLAIDEIGRTAGTPYELSQFFAVLSQRHGENRPTVLCTNMPPSELREFIGPALADRLREGGGSNVLVFDWESQRSSKVIKFHPKRDTTQD